jgi:hypothetical protein
MNDLRKRRNTLMLLVLGLLLTSILMQLFTGSGGG